MKAVNPIVESIYKLIHMAYLLYLESKNYCRSKIGLNRTPFNNLAKTLKVGRILEYQCPQIKKKCNIRVLNRKTTAILHSNEIEKSKG